MERYETPTTGVIGAPPAPEPTMSDEEMLVFVQHWEQELRAVEHAKRFLTAYRTRLADVQGLEARLAKAQADHERQTATYAAEQAATLSAHQEALVRLGAAHDEALAQHEAAYTLAAADVQKRTQALEDDYRVRKENLDTTLATQRQALHTLDTTRHETETKLAQLTQALAAQQQTFDAQVALLDAELTTRREAHGKDALEPPEQPKTEERRPHAASGRRTH